MKKHYEHDTLLFKKKDDTKLKTKVTVGAPARQNFAETFDENEANKTIIEYRARSDDQQDRDRDEIIWREYPRLYYNYSIFDKLNPYLINQQ